MKKGTNKIASIIGIILCVILVPILVINCTLIFKSITNKDEVPSFNGITPMIVLTDSMEPEFSSGDLILCKSSKAEAIQVGDIICFTDPAGNGTSTVTHRVQEITTDENGNLAWITKGDANNTIDSKLVPASNLIGKYTRSIQGLGNVAMYMQTTQGLIICVVCPILLFVAYDMITHHIYEKNRKKDTEALMEELETLKAKQKDI